MNKMLSDDASPTDYLIYRDNIFKEIYGRSPRFFNYENEQLYYYTGINYNNRYSVYSEAELIFGMLPRWTLQVHREPSPVHTKSENETDWGKVFVDIGIALGATVIAGVAIAETVGTGGVGIWNDGIAIGGATTAWANAGQSLAAFGQQIASAASDFLSWLTRAPALGH